MQGNILSQKNRRKTEDAKMILSSCPPGRLSFPLCQETAILQSGPDLGTPGKVWEQWDSLSPTCPGFQSYSESTSVDMRNQKLPCELAVGCSPHLPKGGQAQDVSYPTSLLLSVRLA